MAARTWVGAVSGVVTNVGNYFAAAVPSGTDTLTIPTGCTYYPSIGVYPATGAVVVDSGGEINGVTEWPATTNAGTISAGTFSSTVHNDNIISGGTFEGAVTNDATGEISDGIFKGAVHNDGTITGGTFEGAVAAHAVTSAISGGYFLGVLTYTAGTLVTGAASTIIAAAADVRNRTGRWTGATGANLGTLGHDNPYMLIP